MMVSSTQHPLWPTLFLVREKFLILKRGKARIFVKGFRAIGYHPQALNDNQEFENKYGTN